MSSIYTLGIDVGSTASKCIILKDGRDIVAKSLVDVGTGTSGPRRAIDTVLRDVHMSADEMDYILATGYGRNSLIQKQEADQNPGQGSVRGTGQDFAIADKQMSELSCHAKGAYFLFPGVHTVIDIGGQDVKVLHLDNGIMSNFQMNDKCAAGTGRFLDEMARILEIKVTDMEALDAQSTKEVIISSTCTVFAESEVISQLSMGTDKCDIIRGIHRSVANRVNGLVHRVGLTPEVVMTGGVAQNSGVVKAMEDELGCPIRVSPLTQYNGALGAALFAYTLAKKNKNAP